MTTDKPGEAGMTAEQIVAQLRSPKYTAADLIESLQSVLADNKRASKPSARP